MKNHFLVGRFYVGTGLVEPAKSRRGGVPVLTSKRTATRAVPTESLMKVVNLVGILIAPLAIGEISLTARIVIVLVALIALTIAVLLNRRGSIIKKATSLNWR